MTFTRLSPVVTFCTTNIQKFYVLPSQFIYVFRMDHRIDSDYLPMQHKLTGFL
jgi:hypothetical protein